MIINVPFLKFGGLRFGDSLDFVIPHSAKWPALGRCPGNIADSLTGFDQELGLGSASQYLISCGGTIEVLY